MKPRKFKPIFQGIFSEKWTFLSLKNRSFTLTFILICFLYLCTISDSYWGWINDGRVMFDTAVSLHEFGELAIPNESGSKDQSSTYGKYGLGFSIVQQLPLMLVFLLEKILGDGRSNIIFPFFNLLLTAGTALMLGLTLQQLGFRIKTALLATFTYAFGTFAWPYISYDFSEPLQTFCVMCAFWFLVSSLKSSPPTRFSLAMSGFLLGYSVLTKGFLLVLIPCYVIYVWIKLERNQRVTAFIYFFSAMIIIGVFIAGVNYHRFESVFEFGYGKESYQFTTPILSGLYGLLFSFNKGLIFYAPVTVLAPWALWQSRKNYQPEVVFIVLVIISYIVPTAMWWSWEGGSSWGPRLLLPILPFVVMSAAMILESSPGLRLSFGVSCLIGIGVNLLGVLIFFVGWNWTLGLHDGRISLDLKGRPDNEFIVQDGQQWFLPYVAANYVPGLSPILGHAWLLNLRYLDEPFSINDSSSNDTQLPTVEFSPLKVNFNLLKGNSSTLFLLRSANFWMWNTIAQKPRNNNFSFPLYGLALGRHGDKAVSEGNLWRALYCYKRVAELMPDISAAVVKLSQVQLELKKVQGAKETLVKFLQRYPQESIVRLQLAFLLEKTGRPKAALNEYKQLKNFNLDDSNLPLVEKRIDYLKHKLGQK